jgi:hypothetical protein
LTNAGAHCSTAPKPHRAGISVWEVLEAFLTSYAAYTREALTTA